MLVATHQPMRTFRYVEVQLNIANIGEASPKPHLSEAGLRHCEFGDGPFHGRSLPRHALASTQSVEPQGSATGPSSERVAGLLPFKEPGQFDLGRAATP